MPKISINRYQLYSKLLAVSQLGNRVFSIKKGRLEGRPCDVTYAMWASKVRETRSRSP